MSVKILFLCSGGGGNLRFIYEAINQKWLQNTEICGVLTDRKCGANKFSTNNDIENDTIDFSCSEQSALFEKIKTINPDVVVTTVHRIISAEIVSAFREKLINVHYSLLPAFGGTIGSTPVKQALEYGVKFVGTTVHFVSEDIDAGTPIIQSITPVLPNDNEELIMDSQFRCGCICLLTGILTLTQHHLLKGVSSNVLENNGRNSYFNPGALIPVKTKMESFWIEMK